MMRLWNVLRKLRKKLGLKNNAEFLGGQTWTNTDKHGRIRTDTDRQRQIKTKIIK